MTKQELNRDIKRLWYASPTKESMKGEQFKAMVTINCSVRAVALHNIYAKTIKL